jgi:hypothetical protein
MNKSYLLIFICVSFFFSGGCNKSEVTPSAEYFIKFKVDGVQKEYTTGIMHPIIFSYDQNGPIFNATILVLGQGSSGTNNFINIITRNEEAFQTGKDYMMQDAILYQSVNLARMAFTWADENGNIFNAVLLQSGHQGIIINDDAQIRLTNITDDFVEGVFSAKLFGPADRSENAKLVTEGSFKLKRTDV